MNTLRIPIVFSLLIGLVPAARGGSEPAELHRQALAHYEAAISRFGVAMGERQDDKDPALSQLTRSVAEILCLKGDVEGCLAASKECGRKLGLYSPPFDLKPGEASRSLDLIRGFLTELHVASSGWAKDRSVVSEAIGFLEQARADGLRARLAATSAPKYKKALAKSRKGKTPARLKAILAAGDLAYRMLDQDKIRKVALLTADLVTLAHREGVSLVSLKSSLQALLSRGDAVLTVLGRRQEGAPLRAALESLETKALTPPELEFELGPAAEKFETDLGKARKQLAALAVKAPLRSRQSVLLLFFSAYAGVISGDPTAADPLAVVGDTLAVTDPYLAARSRGLAGRAALLSGDYYLAARELGASAAAMEKQPGAKSLRGLLIANEAGALFYLGRYAEAALRYQEAAALLDRIPSMAFEALLGTAHAWVFEGKLQKAEEAFSRVQEMLETISGPKRAALGLKLDLDRALWLIVSGKQTESIASLEEIIDRARQAKNGRMAAVASTNLAEVLNDTGDHEKAIRVIRTALVGLDQAGQPDVAWQALCEQARALAATGKNKEAVSSYRRAMDLVETLRARIGAEGSRRTFSAAKERLYRGTVSVLADMGKAEDAFRVSERARGRAFLDMLAQRKLRLGDRKLQAKLAVARKKMIGSLPQLRTGFGEPGEGVVIPLRQGSGGQARLPAADPRQGWLSLVTTNPAGAGDVRKVLAKDEALVSFFHDGKRLLVFVVDPSGVSVHPVDVAERDLFNHVQSFLRMLRKPGRSDAKVKKKAKRLYSETLGPVMGALKAKRLVVVPFGPLHYAPFLALWDGNHYLVDRFEQVTAVPSASALVMIRSDKRKKAGNVLALGNPVTDLTRLPSAEHEVAILNKMFRGAKVQVGEKASKKAFLQQAGGSRLIHVATHGVFLPGRPMDSYLALSGDTPEAGRLTATEILGVDLARANLVVLSACDTGRAEVMRGDEVIGLTRAFLHAGARSLLASLWPVSDESTAAMVEHFYSSLRSGSTPARALTEAARKVKAEAKFSHPFFWAPFEAIGG